MALKKARKKTAENVAQTVNVDEVGRFSALAEQWWDPAGPMAPLHKLNPVRLDYIKSRIIQHALSRKLKASNPKMTILDIGCGAGLVAENLAAWQPEHFTPIVTGLDAGEPLIEAARHHAKAAGVTLTYRCGDVDALVSARERFDIILALEVIEHVDAQSHFVKQAASLLNDGGMMIFSTLNRSAKGFLLGIIGAEYVLRWLPRGTHDWRQFVKPSELATWLEESGMQVDAITGLCYSPLSDRFSIRDDDVDVNYILCATQTGA